MGVTVLQVREIRRLDAEGLGRPAIADRLGIGRRYVSEVLSGREPGRPLNPREAAEQLEAEGWTAACMDPDEWELWRSRNPRITDRDMAVRPCMDCPVAFAADMRLEGRCNGEPGRQLPPRFEVPDPVDPVPIAIAAAVPPPPEPPRPPEQPPKREPLPMLQPPAPPAQRHRTVPAPWTTSIELPCGDCAHAPVCVIKGRLDQWRLGEGLPSPDPAITVAATLTLSCEYFMPDAAALSARKEHKPIRALGGSEEGRRRAGQIAAKRQTRHSDDEIEAAVAAADGNLTSAARALGYSQTAVSIRMRKIRERNEADHGVPQQRSA